MEGRARQLLAAPATGRADWLPEGEWAELDELRAEHRRILAARAEAVAEGAELRERFEAEDRARDAALMKRYASDTEVEVPEVTPADEREAAFAPLRARLDALKETLGEFLVRAEKTIAGNYETWSADLDSRDAQSQARVEAARAGRARAAAEVSDRQALRRWLARSAGLHPMFRQLAGRHIPFSEFPRPAIDADQPDPRLKEAAHA
jgi:hypothetical protein